MSDIEIVSNGDEDGDDDDGTGDDALAGGFDLGELLKQAQAMQEQVMAAQATAAEQVVEGSAGGGLVKVEVTGGMDFRSIHIDPSAVDPSDVELLEDLVLAAIHDAVARANEISQQAFGGLGLPGIPGMPGLPGAH
jgi:DNA-binding YbaB/EbfC family protein